MAGDLATMKARIARELARSDLTTQIADAINDAIAAYSSERFRFSDTPLDAPSTFYTVAGQAVYTSANLAALATMYKIDFVNMNVGSASVFGLSPDTAESLLLYNQQSGFMRGQPSWYAYRDNQLILAAVPDQAYLITVGMFLNKAAPASDAETGNPWMTDAERLIRARAKFEIATHVTRNDKMAMMMSPSPPAENQGMVGAAYREWKVLKGVANRVSSRGKVRPMAF